MPEPLHDPSSEAAAAGADVNAALKTIRDKIRAWRMGDLPRSITGLRH